MLKVTIHSSQSFLFPLFCISPDISFDGMKEVAIEGFNDGLIAIQLHRRISTSLVAQPAGGRFAGRAVECSAQREGKQFAANMLQGLVPKRLGCVEQFGNKAMSREHKRMVIPAKEVSGGTHLLRIA